MRLPRNRSLVVAGAVVAVLIAAPLFAAQPAFAEPTGADVEFGIAGNTVVEAAGKPVFLRLFNNGPGTADNIVVKVDISKVDAEVVDVQAPAGCSKPEAGVFLCSIGSLVPGETNTGFSPFEVTSVGLGKTGPAGSFSVEVMSDAPDPNPANNKKVDVPLTVKSWAYDMSVIVEDIWATQSGAKAPVQPGAKAPFVANFSNVGKATAVDPVWQVTLPPFVTFVSEDESFAGDADPARFCTFNQTKTVASCKAAGVEVPEGLSFGSLFTVQVAKDAPGPAALTGGIADGGALRTTDDEVTADEAIARAAAKGMKLTSQKRSAVDKGGDADPSDNVAFFSAHTAANPADLAISATSGSGAVGSVVKITVTVENVKGASSPNTTVTVTAPTGTDLVGMPTNCEFTTPGRVGRCEGLLAAGEKNSGVFSFKITAASVGNDGKATIEGSLDDPNPANNKAAIVITVTDGGGLPITGVKVGVIAGAGGAVLAVGALLFVLTRRRRVELVTPSQDA